MTKSPESGSMIKSIRLRNFKSYRDSGAIEFAPLTVIVGCNNAGKSSILQSLLVLSQTIRDPSSAVRLVTQGDFANLGGYFDLLHGHGTSNVRKLGIEVTREQYGMITAPSGVKFSESTTLGLTFSFNKKANRIEVDEVVLSDSDGPIVRCNESGEWDYRGIGAQAAKKIKVRLRNFLPSAYFADDITMSAKSKSAAERLSKTFDAMMSIDSQAHTWNHFFYDIHRVPPHRAHVPFYVGIGERVRSEGGMTGANLVQAFGSSEPVSTTDKTLLKSVSAEMQRLGAVNNLDLKPLDKSGRLNSLVADDPSGHAGLNVAAMGEGISQVLPVVAAALRSDPYDSLLIEQPEIHLHPALQAELGDLFVDVVNKGKRQLIIETHSEHLLLRLRTHVAKGNILPEDVSFIFVEKDGGESKARRLKLNGRGHFEDWPRGFFDEAYQEAMNLAMAQPKAN